MRIKLKKKKNKLQKMSSIKNNQKLNSKFLPSSKSQISNFSESEYRIIKKNLVYIIGLSDSLSDIKKLEKYEYLGQYGKILKIVINKKKAYNKNNKFGPSYSAYITYNEPYEASIAILSLDNIIIDNHLIRASFGTTKYCQNYLNKIKCNNKECFFLHKKANNEDIICKNDLINNNLFFYNQQIYAIKLADIYNPIVKKKLMSFKDFHNFFPTPDVIYENEVVIDNMPKVKKIIIKKNASVPKKDDKKDDMKIIEKQRLNDIKFKDLESSNSTLTNSNCLTSSISSKSIEANNNINNNNKNNNKENINNNNINDINNEKNNNLNIKNKNSIFSIREKSRFDFVNNDKKGNNEVPHFISKINNLAFKINILLSQSNTIGKENNFLYIDELNDIKNENDKKWKKFLVDNLKE